MINTQCVVHNVEVIVYDQDETDLFVDDNANNVVILTNEKGVRYLKRFQVNGCNEDCPFVLNLLNI